MKRGVWFGLSIMVLIVLATVVLLPPPAQMSGGHIGLLMLSLVVVAIMLGFPTAFTLMGMGMIFAWLAYRSQNPDLAVQQTLDLMVQRTYGVMANDVLISIPLFVFMGYLVERANLIEKLFKSLHLAMARVPGSLAVATLVTCAIFATATGIVGAVVTLMGLLALPAMLRAGYDVKLAAGVITAGGCLGILIPPSVMLIVYGATAGVSVVQLYAGAFFPGIMLACLYIAYVMIVAKLKPGLAPPLPMAERVVPLPPLAQSLDGGHGRNALLGLVGALKGRDRAGTRSVLGQLAIALLPTLAFAAVMSLTWHLATKPVIEESTAGLVEMGTDLNAAADEPKDAGGVQEPSSDLQEPPGTDKAAAGDLQEPPGTVKEVVPAAPELKAAVPAVPAAPVADAERRAMPLWLWIMLGVSGAALLAFYAILNFSRLEIFKMLLASFFPLVVLIIAVLGTIVFGLATPTEAAAIGSLGGFVLAAAYLLAARPREYVRGVLKQWATPWALFGVTVVWFVLHKLEVVTPEVPQWLGTLSMAAIAVWCVMAVFQARLGQTLKESVFLTAKTSAMVCWLFVGSSIFSAAVALLGGQQLIEQWVLSMDLTPIQFMILSQAIIFLLGWPLEWTEIIVIFMPIFIPLLPHFNIDPLFFGLLVALNLQTAFLSPPVAMAAFYLKGVSPPHVTLNQIFLGMLPFMGIQIIAIVLLYMFPQIGLWLPQTLYK